MSRNKGIVVCICALAALFPSALHAISVSEAWVDVYPYPNIDRAYAVAYTADGGCVAVGGRPVDANAEAAVVRIDKHGNEVWSRTYGGTGSDQARAVQALSDGGFIVAGFTYSFGAGQSDYYLIRLDANGDTLWTRAYGGSSYDEAYSVVETPDGGFAIYGGSYSYGNGLNDGWLVRTDANGDTLWTRTYGTANYEWGFYVSNTSDGGFALAGTGGPIGNFDMIFTKTNSAGAAAWTKTYGGGADDYCRYVEPLWNGDYMLAGNTYSFADPDGDALLVRTYSNGDSVWMRTYGGDDYDYAHGVKQMGDSLFLVVAETVDWAANWTDAYLFTMDGTGLELTGATYGGTVDDFFQDISGSFEHGYVLAGESGSYSATTDFWVLKTLGTAPTIESVTDVGNDQGRQVRVRWYRSWYDEPDDGVDITEYTVWRRYEPALAAGPGRESDGADIARFGYPPGEWDYVTSVSARGEDFYSVVVPTLCDSTADGQCLSHFFVSAETPDPMTYFDSDPDSGYSIDNLAPGPPEGLHMMSATELAWDEAAEPDFDYFAVYGSDDGDFHGAEFIGYTVDIYMEVSEDPHRFYHVTATDFAGNEGEPATAENDFAYAGDGTCPAVFALRQNRPNPFRTATCIGFDLPARSHVVIDVIDVHGRVVRTLVQGTMLAERHRVSWDGKDAAGAEAGPGVYFVRMAAGEFSATRKMMLLR